MAGAWDGGQLIRALRERRGYSQEELEELAGVSDRTIRNAEAGARRPRRDTFDRLAGVLDLTEVERDELLAGRHRPCSLPADIADFVGRKELSSLVKALLSEPARPGVSRVCVLFGMPGAGKSTLAIHLAHQLAARYPDGRLYLDLRGQTHQPLTVGEALARLLRRLGVPPDRVPGVVDEAAELLRDTVNGRRMLFVLDDVAGEPHIRPLLPGTSWSAVIATSRRRLPGLAGAHPFEVGVFKREEALELAATVARRDDPGLADVVELCGRLPLAVRIAAARLASRPQWTVAHLAALLADQSQRLSVLAAGDLCVAASIASSCDALPLPARRALGLVSTLEVLDVGRCAAALGLPEGEARRLLEELADANLLQPTGTDRYHCHVLVRVYVRRQELPVMFPGVPVIRLRR